MIAIVSLLSGLTLTLDAPACLHWQEQLSNGAPVRAAIESKWVTEFWPVSSISCIERLPAPEHNASLTLAINSQRFSACRCRPSERSASASKGALTTR